MDIKLWEYIFEMFNYKIRQKKSIFSKLQTLTPPLKTENLKKFLMKFLKYFRISRCPRGFSGPYTQIWSENLNILIG